MMLVIGESGRIRETTLEDFVIPSINVLYCSLQNASHALVHLLKHTSLQSVLCNHVLLFNVKDGVFTDTIYDVITTFQLTTERFECNVSCRFTLPALVTSLSEPLLNSSSSEASRVMHAARISSYTHVIIVGANQTLSEPIIKIAEGEIILPCNATVTSRNLFDVESAFAKVPELYAEFKVCLTSNSRKSILIEDHTDQTAIDIVLHLCQVHKAVVVRLSGSMLKVESGGVHKSSIIAILFNITKAYDNQKCVFVITDLDVILGNVQAADADFEYKVTLIMELQRILEAGTKAVVVGICIDIKTILPPLASSFDFSYTIQRNAVDSQSTSINDAHVDSLYGMDDIMHAFDQTLLCPRVHKEAFKKFGLGGGVCNAVMLTGPSGVGKSVLPMYIAQRYKFSYLSLKSYDVIHSEIGSSEKAIKQFFQQAKRQAPCVLFVDEFLSIFSSQQSSLISVFLSCLDDIKVWNEHAGTHATVIVMAACRNARRIGSEFSLPGRFGQTLKLGELSDKGRQDLFRELLAGVSVEGISVEDDVSNLVMLSQGLTAGLLQLAVKRTEREYRRCILQDCEQVGQRGYVQYLDLLVKNVNMSHAHNI